MPAVYRILVIADDLSGAADCGIAFTHAGLSSVVLFSGEQAAPGGVDVLAVDADSRHLAPQPAAAVHLGLAQRHLGGGALLYKKIDSTLRGNIGAELAAVIPQAGVAIVAPAFPGTGRTTRDGRVYVRDVPLEETEIWRREGLSGVADIAARLSRADVRVARAELDLVRGGRDALRDALDARAREGAQAIVCDAESDADLAAIASASVGMERPHFWVGSAGLARQLPAACGIGPASAAAPAETGQPRGPVLVAVGSLSAVSRGQAERLASQAGVAAIAIAPEALRAGGTHSGWCAAVAMLTAALDRGDDVVLTIGAGGSQDLGEGWLLCEALARLVSPLANRIGSLVATGGETARALLTGLGAIGLRLVREIEPGVVLCTAEGGGRPLPVVTKAGAFGTPDTLMHCRAVLRGMAPDAGT